ncbi:MAG: V-type ATP synthase subunit D [Candidatus Hydrogenedentes bacterium]|nr:V-type ATP synthase subunit D [Candidatus Hydrogenedentota bacterium]
MARYEVAPTRTNLLGIKSDLSLVREGHELLEQKRQILLLELKQLTARAADAQKEVDAELARAYAALREALIANGVTGVSSAAETVNVEPKITAIERRVMGVYGTFTTSVWLDEAVARFQDALRAIAGLAEARIAVVRLARAIQRTIRRVNALEKILIPDYEETLKYVQDSLEESDRQALFSLKLVKESLEKASQSVR